jgi:hypothetical protein
MTGLFITVDAKNNMRTSEETLPIPIPIIGLTSITFIDNKISQSLGHPDQYQNIMQLRQVEATWHV